MKADPSYYTNPHSVRTCPHCHGPLTVVDTVEQVRRPFTPHGLAVVQRERVCKGGTTALMGAQRGCGYRSWSEEYMTAEVPPLPAIESES